MIKLDGKSFRGLVTAVTRYPHAGGFAGSGLVSLKTAGGHLVAGASGLVVSMAKAACTGELDGVAVDAKLLEKFASVVSPVSNVLIENGDRLRMKSGRHTMEAPIAKYVPVVVKTPPVPGVKISELVAARVAYLSAIAFADASRADLSCVMLTSSGRAVACNQQTFASLRGLSKLTANVAVPLMLARDIRGGDVIYASEKETVVASGGAMYSTPAPVKAQNEYPLKTVLGLEKLVGGVLATGDGAKLATLIGECSTCLGQLVRTEVILTLELSPKKLVVYGENGGARFRAFMPLLSGDATELLRAPLENLVQAAPLLGQKKVGFSKGKHNDMFLLTDTGWVMFPAWVESAKK